MSLRATRLLIVALAAISAVLVLLLLVQLAGFGRGYGWLVDDEGMHQIDVGTIDRTPFSLPPESTYSAVASRPLFNEDRKPTPPDAGPEAAPPPPPVPLNITLTGIILTSKVGMAMIQDKARNQAQALKVGMPLEGDQSAWTLVEVKPRSAIFENPARERSEIELETSSVPLPAAAPAPPIQQPAPPRQSPKPGQPQATGQPQQNAQAGDAGSPSPAQPGTANANEDLVKRIEERRRQMREEAEKLRQQPNKAGAPAAAADEKKE